MEELQRQNGLLLLRVREEEERGQARAEAAALRVEEQHRAELTALRAARQQHEELAERAVRQKDVYKGLLARLAQQQQGPAEGLLASPRSAASSLAAAEQCAACRDHSRQRQLWEQQLAALDAQVAGSRGAAERAAAELEWAQGRVAQLERERAAWATERERLERGVLQLTERLTAAEDRLAQVRQVREQSASFHRLCSRRSGGQRRRARRAKSCGSGWRQRARPQSGCWWRPRWPAACTATARANGRRCGGPRSGSARRWARPRRPAVPPSSSCCASESRRSGCAEK